LIDRHLTRLRARHPVSAAEEQAIRDLFTDTRAVRARATLVREDERLTHSLLLLDGLACRYRHLKDGSRHAVELSVPGDFTDLHGFSLKRLDHSISAISDVTVAVAPHERLRALTEEHPRLTRLYWFSTNLDAAIHRERAVSLAGRDAVARTGALFLEMGERLRVVGLANAAGYDLPMTQVDLGECLGLTPVHVNRVLRSLREEGLMRFQRGRVELLDPARLRAAADWDGGYLYLEPAREPI